MMNTKYCSVVVLLLLVPGLFALDIIETRKGVRYQGKIVKMQDTQNGKAFVIKTEDGGTVAVFQSDIARIHRDKETIDLITGERYLLEKRRPFLPFAVVSIASGTYAVTRFQEYNRLHDKAERERQDAQVDPETINTGDQKNVMAAGIVSGIISVGSFLVAVRPMEIKVPMGKVKVSGIQNGVQLALHF